MQGNSSQQIKLLNNDTGRNKVTDNSDDHQDGIPYLAVRLKMLETTDQEKSYCKPERYGVDGYRCPNDWLLKLEPQGSEYDTEDEF